MNYFIQIDDLVREATPSEAAAIEAQQIATEQAEIERAAKTAARQAVLDKLGLTTDEAAALLG